MSNRQSVKLYTEEQVRQAIKMADKYHHILDSEESEIISVLESIELPSDEEIEKESKYKSRYILHPPVRFNPVLNIVYIEGAKWMRDKIQGGNNEQ